MRASVRACMCLSVWARDTGTCEYTRAHTRTQKHIHQVATDNEGRFLIDRNPRYFAYVLDYLRNGGVLPGNLPSEEEEEEEYIRVREEFDYFLLTADAFPEGSRTLAEMVEEGMYVTETLHSALAPELRKEVCVSVYVRVLGDVRSFRVCGCGWVCMCKRVREEFDYFLLTADAFPEGSRTLAEMMEEGMYVTETLHSALPPELMKEVCVCVYVRVPGDMGSWRVWVRVDAFVGECACARGKSLTTFFSRRTLSRWGAARWQRWWRRGCT